ncbi:hypothetical protein [Bacillus cihuensis]|uniref:hypothetical protein n=1 Tax=Bacillus cihuensis TaxID=1208599 RepID=UPI0004031161|nr:hypothetical protein [Bacillus cihuensis]
MRHNVSALEDLIIAALIAKPYLVTNKEGRSLCFKLEERKIPILNNYIQHFHLTNYITINKPLLTGIIHPSIMLERILRDWTLEGYVQTINPQKTSLNMFLIWVALFGQKTEKSVIVSTDLGIEQQRTLALLFYNHFHSNIICAGSYMQIKPFSPLFLRALQSNRPIEECMELTFLLPKKEKNIIKQQISEWEEERSTYAY